VVLEISIPPCGSSLEIPSGSKVISKAKHFKGKYKTTLEFLEGGANQSVQTAWSFCGPTH